ncbi:MAG: hypothetical protein KatS3mg092_0045 [Patescibacteria group bacterium]|nr:MAG: hypothetical protein KatS3mg092_0045 [Patescibacteria group bacterium]
MINYLIISNLLIILIFIFKLPTLPPELPLFYSLPVGEWQLADSWMIFLLPFILNLMFYINNQILNKYFVNEEIAKKIFHYLNLFLIISFTLIFIKIIFLIS